jgi:VanZ family protein
VLRRRLRYWVPVAAWMGVIFCASSLSRPLPESFKGLPDWITHPVAYGVLGLLVCRALCVGGALSWTQALLSLGIGTAYGVTDELHQYFVPGRDASAMDVLKDFIGGCIGAFAYHWSHRVLGRVD